MTTESEDLAVLRGLLKIEKELPTRRANAARALLARGWSLNRIGKEFGVSRQAVWNWLSRNPEDGGVPAGLALANHAADVADQQGDHERRPDLYAAPDPEPEPAKREEDRMPDVFYA